MALCTQTSLGSLPHADDLCYCLSRDFHKSILQVHWAVMLPASAAVLGHRSAHSFPTGSFISPVLFTVTLRNQNQHPIPLGALVVELALLDAPFAWP